MEHRPRIGIIMSVYNEKPEWLCQAIESIINQTYEKFCLYIILDDPNNDRLRDIILNYRQRVKNLVFYENQTNLGLVKSLNKLLEFVTEPYIARMDADDIALPQRLEKEYEFLVKNNLDFVMSGADFLDEDGNITEGAEIPPLMSKQLAECCKYGNVSIHSSWLLKKELYNKLEGYREYKYCEDYDFLLRALQNGAQIGRLNEKLMQYRIRVNSLSSVYILEQDRKARYLRKAYRQNIDISSLDIYKINMMLSKYPEEEKRNYSVQKNIIDLLTRKIYEKNLLDALRLFFKGWFMGKYFRTLFIELFMNRIKMEKIYRMKI